MNKDELLKIYSACLLYDLEVQHDINGKLGKVLGIDANKHELSVCFDSGIWQGVDVRVLKPVFYDLSYLTKEIEHEGETFVPIEKLFGSALAISGYTVFQDFQYKEFAHLTYVKKGLKSFPFLFEQYQKLFEWHFNVFNLSESEYINKATLAHGN